MNKLHSRSWNLAQLIRRGTLVVLAALLGLAGLSSQGEAQTPPAVQSIALVGTPAATAASVQYLVTFNEAVSNITADDFELSSSGVFAGISSVSASSGTSVTVTADVMGGVGTLRLDLKSGSDIENAAGTSGVAPFTSGAVHTVNLPLSIRLGGVVSQSAPLNGSFSHQLSAIVEDGGGNRVAGIPVTFSAPATGPSLIFQASGSNTLSRTTNVNGSVSSATMRPATAVGDFQVTARIDGTSISASTTYTNLPTDLAPPNIRASTIVGSSAANATEVTFEKDFDEVLRNLTIDDFELVLTGTAAGTITNLARPNSRTARITVSSISGSGSVAVRLKAITDVTDRIDNGNNNNGYATQTVTSAVHTVDFAAPAATSIVRQTPSSALTNADTLVFRVTFSEAVQNVDVSDFDPSGTTAAATSIAAVSGSTYDVTLSGGDLAGFDGTVGLDFASAQNITDLSGAAFDGTEPTADETYTLDNMAPILTSLALTTPSSSPGSAAAAVFTVTFSEPVQNVGSNDFTLSGGTLGTIASSGGGTSEAVWTVQVIGIADGATAVLGIASTPTITNAAGNALATTTTSASYTRNTTSTSNARNTSAPTPTLTLTSLTLTTPSSSPGSAAAAVFTATFSQAVQNVGSNDFTVSGGTLGAITSSGGGTLASVWTITVTGIANGTTAVLGIASSPTITNAAGNALAATTATASYTRNAPLTVVISGVPAESRVPFTVTFTFSENVTGFELGDITVGNGTASNFVMVSASTFTALITPTADGTVTVDVAENVAINEAGSGNLAAAQAVSIFTAAPTTEETQAVISRFLRNRAKHILATNPNFIELLDGGLGSGGGPLGNFQGEGTAEEFTINFATSRSSIFAERDAWEASRLALSSPEESSGNHESRRFDFWTQIQGSKGRDGNTKSTLWAGYFGAHAFVTPDLVVGGMAELDWSEETNSAENSETEGYGWMVGPYLVGRLSEQSLTFEARAAWGQSSNKVSPDGTFTDEFDTERFLVAGKVAGAYERDYFTLKPNASLSWYREIQEAYTDNFGRAIPEQTVSIGQLRFGPEFVGKAAAYNNFLLEPSVGVSGVWDFDISNGSAPQNLTSSENRLHARLDVGLRAAVVGSATTLSLNAFFEGIGAENYQTIGASLEINRSF